MTAHETKTTSAQHAVRGAGWSAIDVWTQQLGQLATFILVGNLLGPEVVGVVNMALVAVFLLLCFIENGFGDAVVQRATLSRDHLSAAFWLLLGVGFLACLVLMAAAPAVALFFSEPRVAEILPVLALAMPLAAVSAACQASVQRQANFKLLAIRSLVAYGTGLVVAVWSAATGHGYWSLVYYFLTVRAIDALLLALLSGLRPALRFERAALEDIWSYGRHRAAHNFVSFLTLQFDRIIIGYFLGPTALGLYAVAERLVFALSNGVSGVISRTSFPLLARQQGDRPSFDRTLRSFMTSTNAIALPMLVGLAITSALVIDVIFRSDWHDAALAMSVLCIVVMAQPTNFLLTAATNALGRPDLVLRISLIVLVMRIVVSFASGYLAAQGLASGMLDVRLAIAVIAVGQVVVMYASVPVFMVTANSLFGRRWRYFFGELGPTLLACALMAAAAAATSFALTDVLHIAALAATVAAGVVVYGLAVKLFAPTLLDSALALVRRRAS